MKVLIVIFAVSAVVLGAATINKEIKDVTDAPVVVNNVTEHDVPNVTEIMDTTTGITVEPLPPASPNVTTTTTTTMAPNTTTPIPTTTPKPTTTTPKPTKPTTTAPQPSPTTTSTTTTTTPKPTVAPVTTTVTPPKPRSFDGPSFMGGIVLASGLAAIGFVAFKCYKARNEQNYHTL